MKKIAIIAALAASIAAPAVAQSASTAFAIAHFNQSQDTVSDQRNVPTGENTTRVAIQGNGALSQAFDVFNGSADGTSDLRGTTGSVTIVSGTPGHAQAIFDRLRAESREDE